MSDHNARLHDQALGEALYASTLAQTTFQIIAQTLPRERVFDILDQTQMVLERMQGHVLGGPGAIVHARSRLEGLLKAYSPPQPS